MAHANISASLLRNEDEVDHESLEAVALVLVCSFSMQQTALAPGPLYSDTVQAQESTSPASQEEQFQQRRQNFKSGRQMLLDKSVPFEPEELLHDDWPKRLIVEYQSADGPLGLSSFEDQVKRHSKNSRYDRTQPAPIKELQGGGSPPGNKPLVAQNAGYSGLPESCHRAWDCEWFSRLSVKR